MNEISIVLVWKFCKGIVFDKVKDLLISLKDRFVFKGCFVNYFYIDNCC